MRMRIGLFLDIIFDLSIICIKYVMYFCLSMICIEYVLCIFRLPTADVT